MRPSAVGVSQKIVHDPVVNENVAGIRVVCLLRRPAALVPWDLFEVGRIRFLPAGTLGRLERDVVQVDSSVVKSRIPR